MSVEKLFENAPTKTILAPMAGYTDLAFRSIAKQYGVGLTVTEMVSAKALVMGNQQTNDLLHRLPNDNNCFCQIFGHEPDVMAECVTYPELAKFEGIDINMGCPVKKIVKGGDGSALLENPTLASKCIAAVKNAIGTKPLSVKFRLGVDDDKHAVDFAKMCADSGADFITVHFRTRKQMYAGKADFTLLPQIANCGVPVFANGDVATREQYLHLLDMGAFGVAVGRSALGRPQIFAEIANLPYAINIPQTIALHAQILLQYLPDKIVANELKKHVCFYLKGKRSTKNTIVAVNLAKSTNEILQLVENYFNEYPQFIEVTND